jgi:hypothetical protein
MRLPRGALGPRSQRKWAFCTNPTAGAYMKSPLQIATANVGGAPQMNEQSITIEEALRLSSRAEDHFFDRKAPGLGGAKLQKLVVGFANADGGELIIGMPTRRKKPTRLNAGAGSRQLRISTVFCRLCTRSIPRLKQNMNFSSTPTPMHYVYSWSAART